MNPILNTAFKAARKAGDMMIRASANLDAVKVDSKAFNDFVSDIDRQSESILLDTLFYSYPTHLVRSEEGGYFRASKTREGVTIEQMDAADVPAVPEYEWIIDPLDGTTNFLHGLPHWAVSIALEHKGEIVAAVVFDAAKDEMYTAEKGGGAWMNGTRLRVSGRRKMIESIFATGGSGKLPATLQDFARIAPVSAGIRRFGSAALDLAYVAAGRVDGYWERDIHAWDVAAGILLVKEAGGFVETIRGEGPVVDAGNIVCSNAALFGEFAGLVRARD